MSRAPKNRKNFIGGYASDNRGTSLSLFNKRIRYDSLVEAASADYMNVVDFNVGEQLYYGRMNRLEIPIVLRDNNSNMRACSKAADSSNPPQALNFVIALFEKMARQFEIDAAKSQIHGDTKYLSSLRVFKGYQDPWVKYTEYRDIYFNQIEAEIQRLPIEKKPTDIIQFMDLLYDLISKAASIAPFTFPSFVKSKYNDVMSTGLALEIADINYADDQSKINEFVESPNWSYYLNSCNTYGFRVDKKYPFRIVVDLAAPKVSHAAQLMTRSPSSVGGILTMLYTPASQIYLMKLPQELLHLYNLTVPRSYREKTMCPDGVVKVRTRRTKRYNVNSLIDIVGIDKIFNFYMRLRFDECGPPITDAHKEEIITDCLKIYINGGNLQLPMTVFEANVSTTVDKIGSFDYYKQQAIAFINELKKRGMMEEAFGTLSADVATSSTGDGGGY